MSFPGLGLDFKINPVAFSLGDFKVYWYGVIIAVAFLLAVSYGALASKRYNVSDDKLMNCALVGLVTAIIGARLYYVIFSWENYKDDLISVFYIHNGGLAIYGGLIGGLAGGLITAKVQRMKIAPCLDLCAVSFLIGQGIGRWGNFMNQEAFGTETELPWRMISEGTNNVAVHPCFLYESVWCLLGVLLLYTFSIKWQRYYGQVGILYLIWYGFERTIVEGLRTDSLYLPFKLFSLDIRVSQALSALMVIAGIILLIIFRKRNDYNVKERKVVTNE